MTPVDEQFPKPIEEECNTWIHFTNQNCMRYLDTWWWNEWWLSGTSNSITCLDSLYPSVFSVACSLALCTCTQDVVTYVLPCRWLWGEEASVSLGQPAGEWHESFRGQMGCQATAKFPRRNGRKLLGVWPASLQMGEKTVGGCSQCNYFLKRL